MFLKSEEQLESKGFRLENDRNRKTFESTKPAKMLTCIASSLEGDTITASTPLVPRFSTHREWLMGPTRLRMGSK